MPEVAIILPVFNSELYLHECVKSLLNQTYKDFLLYAIDDGSNDNSLQILESFSDKRIKIYSNIKNEGLIYSLNKGIKNNIDSNFIARMDADDISHQKRIEESIAVFKRNKNIGVVGTSVQYFGDNMKSRNLFLPESSIKIVSSMLVKNPIVHPSVIIRSKIFYNLSNEYDYNFVKYEDYKLWIDLIGKYEFYNLQKILLYYRRHNNNVSNISNYIANEDLILFSKLIELYLLKFDITPSTNELYIISIITSTYRWSLNKHIKYEDLYGVIISLLNKLPENKIDKYYLSHLIWERVFVYLYKCKRMSDILKLSINLNFSINYNKIYSIHKNWF